MVHIHFQKEKIDSGKIIDSAGTGADGSLLCFIGRARNKSRGREVTHLEYEIYESMARRELQKIADHAGKTWGLNFCTIVHRHGRVDIGEASIIICVASPHRDESYMASRYIIDTIKKTVPIWKKEHYSDGSVWITDRN